MGRPRNAAMDEAIRQVTMELLRERGYGRLHLSDVIRRAGVSSASVYRRWPSKRPLVLELGRRALAGASASGPAALSVREGLLDLLTAWSRPEALVFLRSALPALIAEAAHDEELAAGLRHCWPDPATRSARSSPAPTRRCPSTPGWSSTSSSADSSAPRARAMPSRPATTAAPWSIWSSTGPSSLEASATPQKWVNWVVQGGSDR